MPASTSAKSAPTLKLQDLVRCISTLSRWRIFVELAKGEALPAMEIARRILISRNGASKQLIQLRKAGVLERTYGNLYRIPKHFFVPGEPALDFGAFVLRLDYPDPRRK